MRPGFGKRIAGPLRLLSTSLVAGLIAVELALRFIGYAPGQLHHYDPLVGWTVRGDTDWRTRTSEFAARVRTNAFGMRSDPFPREKPPGEKRVLLVGDSIVLAAEVDRQHTVGTRIARGLDDLGRVRVLPMGSRSWSTDQELLYLREGGGFDFEPDVVVLFFHPNDLIGLSRQSVKSIGRRVYKPFFTLEGKELVVHNVPVPAPDSHLAVDWLREHVATYSFIQQEPLYDRFSLWLGQRRGKLPAVGAGPGEAAGNGRRVGFQTVDVIPPRLSKLAELGWALIEAIQREVQTRGSSFLLVVVPSHQMIAGTQRTTLLRWFAERATRDGVPHVALWDVMVGHPEFYFASNVHWNPHGHAAAARAVLPAIRQLLESEPTAAASGAQPEPAEAT